MPMADGHLTLSISAASGLSLPWAIDNADRRKVAFMAY